MSGSRSASSRSAPASHGSHDSMPSKVWPSARRSHCSRPQGSDARRAAARSRTSSVGSSSRQAKRSHLGALGGGALVGHRELGQAVDLVAPQVDAHRLVGGGGEHVDDRAPHGDLAPVLDLVLPAVAEVDQLADQVLLVDLRAGADDHGGDVLDVRAEALDQGPDRGDHDAGGLVGVGQVPDRPQAAAHRLHRRADPLEGQGLPRREHVDAVLAAEDPQVVGQALGFGAGRRGHHDRVAGGDLGQAGDEDGPRRLRDGQGRRGRAEDVGQDRLVPQQRGERAEGHRPNLGPPQRRAAGRDVLLVTHGR